MNKMYYKKTALINLNYVEINHLLSYIRQNELEGCYWGNLEQFVSRQEKLKTKLNLAKQSLIDK